MQYIAHRGAPHKPNLPNSIEAIKALPAKSWCEIDIQQTKDKKFVLHHDPEIAGKVIAQNNATDLQLPFLDDALNNVSHLSVLQIDMKRVDATLVASKLKSHTMKPRLIVSSFETADIAAVKASGLKAEYRLNIGDWDYIKEALFFRKSIRASSADSVSFHRALSFLALLSPRKLDKAVYTLQNTKNANKYKVFGINQVYVDELS